MDFAWGTVIAVVALLLGSAMSFVGMSPAHFSAARVCFILSAILLGGMSIVWQVLTPQPLWFRVIIGLPHYCPANGKVAADKCFRY